MTTRQTQAPFKFQLKLNPETGVYEGVMPETTEVLDPNGGDLSQVNAGGIARFEIAEIPVGAAVVGTASAGVADVVIAMLEPFIPRIGLFTVGQRRGLLLLLAAMATQSRFVKQFLSAPGANAAALLLTVDALITVFNARRLVSGILGRFAPRLNGATAAAATAPTAGGNQTGAVAFVNNSDAPIGGSTFAGV